MKSRVLKSVISLLLVLVMACSLPLSVSAVSLVYYPVVYVAGVDESYLYENPNKTTAHCVFGTGDQEFVNSCISVASSLAINSDGLLTQATRAINNIFDEIACRPDGTSANPNVGTWFYNQPLSYYPEEEINTATLNAIAEASGKRITLDDIWVFTSDWRIDPFENASGLEEYIDMVTAKTGSKKVTLLCGGTGGVTAVTYLYASPVHAKQNVDSVTFLNSPLWGNGNVGDLMTGHLYQTIADASSALGIMDIIDGTTRGEAFTNYMTDDPTGFLSSLLKSFLGEGNFSSLISSLILALVGKFINDEGFLKDIGMTYNTFVMGNDTTLYGMLSPILRNMPGVWAVVPPDYYDDAIDFMFGSEYINPALYDKITAYRDVMADLDGILESSKRNGIKIYIVVNYGISNLPLTASINDESDGNVTTRHASAGAVTEECPVSWEGFDNCPNAYHDHMEPSGIIDASTGVLPENTWYIKGVPHMDFKGKGQAEFIIWLMTSDTQQTVWTNGYFPQFLKYNKYSQTLEANVNALVDGQLLPGDCNTDGKVDVEDARFALRLAIGLENDKISKELRVAIDVDASGYVEVSDARLILRHAIGLDHDFPCERA